MTATAFDLDAPFGQRRAIIRRDGGGVEMVELAWAYGRARAMAAALPLSAPRANVLNEMWNAFEQHLAAVERSHSELQTDVAGIAQATAEGIDALTDQHVELSRNQRKELRDDQAGP
jgi:hypothetical protein